MLTYNTSPSPIYFILILTLAELSNTGLENVWFVYFITLSYFNIIQCKRINQNSVILLLFTTM
jgi:hypothetical protein